MSKKVSPLNPESITPEVMLQYVNEEAHECKAMYVVGIDEEGEARVWGTGKLSDLAFAKLALEDLALRYFNGEISDE